MRISKIGAFTGIKSTTLNKNIQNGYVSKSPRDSFEKSRAISFKADMKDVIRYSVDWGFDNFLFSPYEEFDVFYPKHRKLNILKGDKNHLRDVAESLCMYSDEDIEGFTKVYYPFHFDEITSRSKRAFGTIMPYITQQRTRLVNLLNIKQKLEATKEHRELSVEEQNGLEYVTEEIERIDKKCQEAPNKYLLRDHVTLSDDDNDNWAID